MSVNDIGPTLAAKSDQLNAADLMGGPITVTMGSIKVDRSKDQPVIIQIGDGRQPFKPCLSMRRALAAIYGESSKEWSGNSLTLYCDPTVTMKGAVVGGIRISHATGINGSIDIPLRKNRHLVEVVTIYQLTISLPCYSPDDLKKNLPAWREGFKKGTVTAEQLIRKMKSEYTLTEEQEKQIHAAQAPGDE